MPLRAFFDSDASAALRSMPRVSTVLMPLRAFFDSDSTRRERGWFARQRVLMPLRAFFDSDYIIQSDMFYLNV